MAFALSETLTIAQPEALGLLPANMLISNVRGPERPLYLNGARLETFFPVSTLIVGVGLNITFMSYADQMVFGYTANGSSLPEVESMARYTTEAFDALERRAAGSAARRAVATCGTAVRPCRPAGERELPGDVRVAVHGVELGEELLLELHLRRRARLLRRRRRADLDLARLRFLDRRREAVAAGEAAHPVALEMDQRRLQAAGTGWPSI